MIGTNINSRGILIGEAPGIGDSGTTPLLGGSANKSGSRLREMTGLSAAQWLGVRRVNLITLLPWDQRLAHTTARAWMHSLLVNHDAVLLGVRVRRAFGLGGDVAMCTWVPVDHLGTRLAWIPHPSGRNIVFNDPAVRRRVGRFVHGALLGEQHVPTPPPAQRLGRTRSTGDKLAAVRGGCPSVTHDGRPAG